MIRKNFGLILDFGYLEQIMSTRLDVNQNCVYMPQQEDDTPLCVNNEFTTTEVNQENGDADDDNLQARVGARREFIVNEGLKYFGTSPECGPHRIPDWYDAAVFRRAQRLYRVYGAL